MTGSRACWLDYDHFLSCLGLDWDSEMFILSFNETAACPDLAFDLMSVAPLIPVTSIDYWKPNSYGWKFLTNFPQTTWMKVISDSSRPWELYSSWNSLGQHTGLGSLSLLQGIFPTKGSNPGLLQGRVLTNWATREALHRL